MRKIGVAFALLLCGAVSVAQQADDAKRPAAPAGGNASGPSRAQNDKSSLPPVPDILAWISSNMPPIAADTDYVTWKQELTSQGCMVTYTSTITNYKRGHQRPANKHAVTTIAIDLSKLSPDSVKVIAAPPGVQIHSDAGFNIHTKDWIISADALLRHETEPDELVEDDQASEVFGYAVSDAAMATRAGNAWHDAIVSCGTKPVPKNLY